MKLAAGVRWSCDTQLALFQDMPREAVAHIIKFPGQPVFNPATHHELDRYQFGI